MRVLTDDPALVAAFFPSAQAHQCQRTGGLSLPPLDRALIEAFGGRPSWSADLCPRDPFWSTIFVSSCADVSQFDTLDRMTRDQLILSGPVACVASAGEGFHGQRGRSWVAVPGNLHVSVAVPLGLDAAVAGVGLSMLPAMAALDAIAETSGGAILPAIKWVNDIVIADRKLGGLLTAAHTTNRTIDDVVWGFGINVEVAPQIAATPFVHATTCLRAERGGGSVTVARLFRALLTAIAGRRAQLARSGSRELFSAYRSRSVVVGRDVQVWDESACAPEDPAEWGPPLAEGVVADIADDLSLRLEGQSTPVTRGRLAMRPPQATC